MRSLIFFALPFAAASCDSKTQAPSSDHSAEIARLEEQVEDLRMQLISIEAKTELMYRGGDFDLRTDEYYVVSYRRDLSELRPANLEVFKNIDVETKLALGWPGAYNPRLGDLHKFWKKKQAILREKYSIQWRHPDELNPNVLFD